jgi:hypothetical protein
MSVDKEATQGWTWDSVWVLMYSFQFLFLMLWWDDHSQGAAWRGLVASLLNLRG